MMKNVQLNVISAAICSVLLVGCGDTKTTIIEKAPIPVAEDEHDHDEGQASAGRLIISEKNTSLVNVYDLNDNGLLGSFNALNVPSALYSTPGHRFALVVQRTQDKIEVIDGGEWAEDHDDHKHVYVEDPAWMDFSLDKSRPTHVTYNESQVAVFFDGNADSGVSASVSMFSENDILTDNASYPSLNYNVNMHGVAQPRGKYLLSTLRETTATSVLPDKIGLYHAHDDHFHDEMVFAVSCPLLHGSAQNEDFVSFACSDGVVLIKQEGETFSASKLAYPDDFAESARIGHMKGHHDNASFIGDAANNLYAIAPNDGTISLIDWEAEAGSQLKSYGFIHHGEGIVVLDDKGYLTLLTQHTHEGITEWEVEHKIDISDEDISAMPDGSGFELSISHASDVVYVSDPIAQHVLTVDLDSAQITNDLELDFIPAQILWLGIAENSHEHE